MTEPDETAVRLAMSLLLAEAADYNEHDTIVRVAVRAALMWHCPACQNPNYADRTACFDCRTVRAAPVPD